MFADETLVTENSVTVSIPMPLGPIDLESIEKNFIRQALERTGGNQSKAARNLGISRYALRYRMEKFGIKS